MSTAPRENHSYYAGFHSWEPDPQAGAFQIRWLTAAYSPNGQAAWWWSDPRDGIGHGPYTSSRAAFRAARLSYDRKTNNTGDDA